MGDAASPGAAPAPSVPAGMSPAEAEARASGKALPPKGGAPGQGKAGVKPEGAKAPPESQRFKVKTKVDGAEEEEDVSLDDLVSSYQQRKAVGVRFREVAQQRAELERAAEERANYAKGWRENPVKALMAETGMKRREALDWLATHMVPLIEQEQLSPEGKALLEERARREELEGKLKGEEEAKAQAAFVADVEKRKNAMAQQWKPALEKSGLPADALTLAMLAQSYKAARDTGLDLTPDELAKDLVDREIERQEALFGRMEGEQLLNAFPELTRKVHKALIDRYERRANGGGQPIQRSGQPRRSPEETNGKKRLMSDKEMNRLLGIGRI
jgi:hypothetical protein